ncbi:MAG TPA: choline/carnitine O-acyltransferase [Virgibacillus sp.]|nr:choline/carnitine O-acyltransferase [Virgibacillus sp.]HLR67802.1 choline/carnitine O-acyltransferase [Virgibacillus sp.]
MNKVDLPILPIPTLEETKVKLLEWIEPLVSEEQFAETTKDAEMFFRENGVGEQLQKDLLAWRDSREGSWLKPFWDEGYLAHRGSMPLEMNYSLLVEEHAFANNNDQPSLIAETLAAVTKFYHLIVDGELAQEKIKDIPLCMSQFNYLFKSARIPGTEKDSYKIGAMEKDHNFVILAYRNRIYQLFVSDENGEIIPPDALREQIEKIVEDERETAENVGIFTAVERETSLEIYDKLNESPQNTSNLQAIQDALVWITIADSEVELPIKHLFANPTSRYFDKTVEILFMNEGDIGFNCEHTGIDGTTVLTLINYIHEQLQTSNSENPTNVVARCRELEWEISDDLSDSLAQLEKTYENQVATYTLASHNFTDFGSDTIKKLGISPDAFFHIGLQIAQYRLFGKIRSTYEPVAIRFFREERTESARASSREKTRLAIALTDEELDDKTLYEMMQEASNAHSARIKDCQIGKGIERHLFGLEKMAERSGVKPALFADAAYQALQESFLSTSGLAVPNLQAWLFGPVVENGYGIAYAILPDRISVNITSNQPNDEHVEKLYAYITEAFFQLKEVALAAKE